MSCCKSLHDQTEERTTHNHEAGTQSTEGRSLVRTWAIGRQRTALVAIQTTKCHLKETVWIRSGSAWFNSIYLNGAQSFGTTCSTQVCDWCLLLRQLESFIERFGQWITMRTDKLKMRISWKQLDYVRNAEACHRKRQACFEWTFTRLNFYEKKRVRS